MESIQLHRSPDTESPGFNASAFLFRVELMSATRSLFRFRDGMCAGALRSARFQLCIHMSKMAILINVHILSMLHVHVENGRRN